MRTFLILSLCLLASAAHPASFDCRKAAKPVEHAICHDARLNEADSRLGRAYQALHKALPKALFNAVRANQYQWLARRDSACPGAVVDCLLPIYEQRIAALEFRLAPEYPVSAAGRASGHYQNGEMRLYAEALAADRLWVQIDGVEPTMARWICEFSGSGSVSRDGTLYFPGGDDAASVRIVFQGPGAQVSEEADRSYYCGHGGTLTGLYRKRD